MQEYDDAASNTSSRHSRANALGAGAANSSKQLSFPEPNTTKLLTNYFPLFPILLTFKRANLRVVSTIGLVLFAMQHWAFVLNPRMKDHLGYQLGNVIAYIVYGSQLSFYDPVMVASASVTAFLVVVYLLLAVTLVLVGCILFHLRPMDDHSEGKGITSDAARLLLNVMSTALLIPILQFCFASCVCGSSGYMWMLPNVENAVCWGSSHIAAFIPSLICLIMLIPLLYLKNTCVYDYAILSDTFQSRRHSVVEKMTFVRDVMSCLLFNVMLGWEVPLGYTILHAVFSGLLVLSYMFFLPYYSMWMNRFYVCVHTIECLISVFVSCSLNNFSLTDGDATTALFLGVGSVICLLAAICTDIRINPEYRFALAHASQCYNTSANWEVESDDEDIDASEDDLHFGAAAKVDDDVVNGLTYPKGIVQNTIFCQYAGLNRQVMESIAQQEINMMVKSGSMGVQKHKTYPVLEPYVSYVYVDTDIALAASSIDLYAMRFEPEQLSDMMLVYGANLYSRALTTFADNAEVMLAFAAFITSYLPGLSFMGVDLVKRSLRGRVTTDQQFRCLRQSNELRTALGIRTHSHAMFSLKARSAHGKALQSIHKFWVKLTEPSVNIKEVSEVADTISERCDVAIAHFESALRNMRGADHVLLRRLGDFFSEVMMAPDAAQECNSEARDIYEARQARSMRGTRQHTQLEVDSAALSERMMALLQYHRRGGSVTSRNSVTFKLMKAFALAISVLFLCLIACSCLFIVCATLMSRNMDNFMECTKSVADLMIASSRFSSNVLIYLSGVTGSAYTELMELQTSLMRMFVEDFKFISSGGGQPQNDVPVYMMTKNTVPFYQVLLENTNGVSLWALGELYLQAMLQFVKGATDEGGAVVGASWNELFLINTGSVVSTSFLTYLETYASKELPDFANLWTGLLLLIFLLTIAFVSLIYFGIASAFQKVALSRVFIFQLFTLIPFDTLERLAVETKEKYHRIEIDKSFKHSEQNKGSRDEGMMATIAVEEKQAYQFMHGDVQVRSCLKPGADCSSATRTHGERRVHFNPVIEVVGQKDEHPDDKKAGDRFDADEDDMSLTLQQSARSKKDKHNDDTIEHKTALFGTLLFFIAAVASTVTLIALLAMNLTEYYNVYYPDIRNYLIYRTTLIQISQSVVMTNSCLRRFILSGSLVDFRNANAYIATAIQSLPSLMGPAFTSDATVKLVRMHFLLQLIGNLTFDAGVLSAKFHNSSLSDWSMLAQLYDLPADTLLQYMEDKYPAAKSYAAKVMDSTGGDVSEMIVVALIIQNLDGVDYASEFHQLYFDVVAALSKRMARIVDMRSPLLLSSLIISAVMTAIPLVIMALPTRRHILQYFGFRHMISTAAAFGFILIVCGLMEGEGLEIIHVQSSYKGEFAALNDYLNAIQQRIGYSIGFIITAKQLFWFDSVANDPTIPMVQLSDALMSNLITPAIAKNFSRSSLSADRIMELSNISTALAIHSMKDLISLEEPILDALNHSWWDIRTEVDYLDIIVKYPMPVYYNTSESDLLLTASEQYQIALNVMCGPEFFNAVETFSEAISSLYYSLCDEEYHRALHCVGKQKILGIIGLSLCILPALACIWMGTTALALVKEVLHVNATTSHQTYSADAARYHTMLRRAQVVLIFLAFLYAITFAVGVWITQIGFVYSTRLSFAARQGAYLSQSLHYILMVLSSYITYISLDQVSNALTSMLADVNNFYLGETSMGIPVGLQVSRQFDEQQLGFADLTTALPVMLSYLNTPCNKRIAPKPLPLLDANYLNELEHPVVEGLMTWTALMGQITSSLDNYATAAFESQVATALPKLQVLSSPLQDAVENSTVVFHSRMSNITDNFMGVLLGFAVATIVLTVLTFLFVIVPTIIMLLKEDESVGMLLRLIPVSVHEEVPAIAHFLVTGDTSNSSEMYQKFEANEKLLQNILPEKIAARLKSGEQPIADTHDCVTMLFTDFVGFTKRSSTMQAREIVDFLNEVFLEFDTVVELLSLEKIKTIGDAFFMAAGLDAQMRDHALRVVEAGLMFFEALEEHNRRHPSRVPLQMRLGVHSGPVVAGVIGIKKVAYDLWGDSVEIANAMESTGVPGYVHISESTAELVRGFFKLEPRGELPREKEHIPDDMPKTYLVVGRLMPTPYMHLRRPKMVAVKVA